MNAEQVKELVAKIMPGKTYPRFVHITEQVDGKPLDVRFNLQSYYVGMYAAIHVNNAQVPAQTGDHDNKKFVRGLKKDILKALERGATIEIGTIDNIKQYETND